MMEHAKTAGVLPKIQYLACAFHMDPPCANSVEEFLLKKLALCLRYDLFSMEYIALG